MAKLSKENTEYLLSLSESDITRTMFKRFLARTVEQVDGKFQLSCPVSDGWFTTSDFVKIDGNQLEFIRRGGRLVKVLGELVDLDELENQLSIAYGAEVLLVAIEEPRRGHILVPVLEESAYDEVKFGQLNFSGLQKLAPGVVVDSIPRNAMGKLDRAKLLESVVISRQSV